MTICKIISRNFQYEQPTCQRLLKYRIHLPQELSSDVIAEQSSRGVSLVTNYVIWQF